MPLYQHVKRFIAETVEPMSMKFAALGEGRSGDERWQYAPGQLEALGAAKDQAKKEGLWNFFLPDADTGEGLSNLGHAYIAAELGKSAPASECMNCSAPDTGNMEVLERVGTPAQKERWLKPLLNGEIRSAYAMTEVHHASSDAKNIATTAVLDGDDWVINGEKHYVSGAGSPRCKILITMARTDAEAAAHSQQSMILVPKDIADAARLISQEAVQLRGGMGMTEELKISHSFRRLTMAAQRFGDADHHLERYAALS